MKSMNFLMLSTF